MQLQQSIVSTQSSIGQYVYSSAALLWSKGDSTVSHMFCILIQQQQYESRLNTNIKSELFQFRFGLV